MLELLKNITSRRLSVQLAYLVMIVTAFVLASFGWYQYHHSAGLMEAELSADLKSTSHILATSIAVPIFSYDIHAAEAICMAMISKKEVNYISISNVFDQNFTFYKTDQELIIKAVLPVKSHSDLWEQMEILHKGQSLGELTVGVTKKYLHNSLEKTRRIILSQILLLEVFLVVPLIILLRYRFIFPLQRLTGMTSNFGKGELDQTVKGYWDDELGDLAKTFVEMRNNIKGKIGELNKEVIEHKRAEDDLRNLRNYLSNIIDSMPSVLIGVDVEGKITQWNKMAEKTTGIPAPTAGGKALSDVFPRMASQMDRISESIRTAEVKQEKKRAWFSKEGTCYEDITVYPLITNGVDGAIIRVDDVTNNVQMEEVMIQSEKMLSVGGLAAGMAHEINNPLAGMMQTANVMSERLSNIKIPANVHIADELGININDIAAFVEKRGILRMLNTINESGCRIAEIVDNMLSFSRKNDDSVSSNDPVELLDKILELAATDYDLKKQYDFKAIEIIKNYESDLPMIRCEGAKIQQVLLNILRNGAQAMQEDLSEGEKSPPRFILRLKREITTNNLRIEIEDNGPGMDEKTRKRVFEPFFTTKPVGIGTGLGLSVSYFIITENHQGTMEVLSKQGEGSKFIIRLPIL